MTSSLEAKKPRHQILTCRLGHFFRDHLNFVRQQYMLYLEHKAINQTEVSMGYPHNRSNRLFIGLAVTPDGSPYVSDDGAWIIYRITYLA